MKPDGLYKFEGLGVGCVDLNGSWSRLAPTEKPTAIGSNLVRVYKLDEGDFAVYWETVRGTASSNQRAVCEDFEQAQLFAIMVGRSESDRLTRK